jgi:thioredoxin 1
MVAEINSIDAVRSGNVLIDFYTPQCGPCKVLHGVLEELSREFSDVKMTKVDVTKDPDMAQRFGVMSVPTVVFLKDAQVRHVSKGFSNKANLTTMMKKFL